jgi:Ca-activated chloride channel family protein
MWRVVFLLVLLVCASAAFGQRATEGSLYAVGKSGNELGACPLKNTVVKAEISGFVSRVRVKQEFENSFSEPIEAFYVFPLSQNGAVDEMSMTVGTRVIRGKIMRRDEARQTYEAAKTAGKTASLLDQERPNIFTQSVANIMPGEKVVIDISYVETLKYEDGSYEFVFPMTVGPRYIPGGVVDAAKIAPPMAATRNGSDISIEVSLNAGVPVEEVRSSTHELTETKMSSAVSQVVLRNAKTIPNKDFILRYDVTGKRIEDAVLVHRDPRGGFFTMILQPPDKIATEDRTPKEIVFVLDTSGSMGGFPIEKAKEAMRLSLDGLYPEDTFNLITFAGDTHVLFEKPVPATRANLDAAQAFLASRSGGGGTEMMKAIKTALDPSGSQSHLRIVCFMTDGFVGNDNEIIAEIQRHPNARVFSFGIGSSVNRFLLDKMAAEGKGEVEYVGLQDDGSKAAKRFYERVRTPLLTDLSIDWNGLPVADVYPGKLTDLFSAKPVVLHGRYTSAANGTIKLRGKVAGQPYERTINVNLPAAESANDSLASLWARTRIDDLSSASRGATTPQKGAEIDKQITDLALEFGLMSNFTSFVAVEEVVKNPNGSPNRVDVPSVTPEGVTPDGQTAGRSKAELQNVYKKWTENDVAYIISSPPPQTSGNRKFEKQSDRWGDPNGRTSSYSNGTGSGSGVGSGSGNGNGVGYGSAGGLSSSTVNASMASQSVIVEVTGTALSTSESSVQTNITTKTIEALPLQARRVSNLLALTPGVSADSSSSFVVDGVAVQGPGSRNKSKRSNKPVELEGRTLLVVSPDYPEDIPVEKGRAEVVVDVLVDVSGKVVEAKARAGAPKLRSSAEKAALLSQFVPMDANGTPVGLQGQIVYRFAQGKEVDVAVRAMKATPLGPTEKRIAGLASKLHVWLFTLVERLDRAAAKRAAEEERFVRDGKAEIRITLASTTKAVLEKLRALGFEQITVEGKVVSGRIPIGKLRELAEIAEVELVVPKL